jgi:hypothetical protein
LTQKSNIIIFITQLGGLYTAMLGISGLLLGFIRYFLPYTSSEEITDASSISLE